MPVCFVGKLAWSRGGTSAQMGSFHTRLANLAIWISSSNFIMKIWETHALKCSPALEVAFCRAELPSIQFSYVRPRPALTREWMRVCVLARGALRGGAGDRERFPWTVGRLAAWCGWQMRGNLTCKWLYTRQLFKTGIKQLNCCNSNFFDCPS